MSQSAVPSDQTTANPQMGLVKMDGCMLHLDTIPHSPTNLEAKATANQTMPKANQDLDRIPPNVLASEKRHNSLPSAHLRDAASMNINNRNLNNSIS